MMYNDGTKAGNHMVWPEFTVRARFVHTSVILGIFRRKGAAECRIERLGTLHMET